MEQPGAPDKSIDWPVEEERIVETEPVEVSFTSTEHYGSHDSRSSGEDPREVESAGRVGSVINGRKEWATVLPGIEFCRSGTSWSLGESGQISITTTIRVHPEACPALIRVRRIQSYSSEFSNAHDSSKYAVRVVRGTK